MKLSEWLTSLGNKCSITIEGDDYYFFFENNDDIYKFIRFTINHLPQEKIGNSQNWHIEPDFSKGRYAIFYKKP